MKPLLRKSQSEFDDFLPSLREDSDRWHMIAISFNENCPLPYDEIIAKLVDVYNGVPGVVYDQGYFRVVCLIKLHKSENPIDVKMNLTYTLPSKGLCASIQTLTPHMLQVLQRRFLSAHEGTGDLYEKRHAREASRVLVVDDDMMINMTVKRILSENYTVRSVSDPTHAVEVYKDFNPDAVLLDIHMPQKSGLDLIHDIFECDFHAYVVMLTADREQKSVLTAIERGATGYVIKPIEKEKVYGYLSKCITFSKEAAA